MENTSGEQTKRSKWIEEHTADKVNAGRFNEANIEFLIEEALQEYLGPRLNARLFPISVHPVVITDMILKKYNRFIGDDEYVRVTIYSIFRDLMFDLNEKGAMEYTLEYDANDKYHVTITGAENKRVVQKE